MKHRILLAALVILMATIAPIRQAKAASCVLLSGTANAIGSFQTVGYYNVIAGHQILYEFNAYPGTPDYTIGLTGTASDNYGPTSYTFTYKSDFPDSALNMVTDTGKTLSFTVIDLSCAGSSQGGVTWFNRGDGRVDGQPGDRLAVWCNTDQNPQTIVVYGIGDQTNGSNGFFLFKITPEKVEANSESIRAIDAGQGNGTVSIVGDGKGDFYIAWNGGIFHATGQGPFAKTVHCDFD